MTAFLRNQSSAALIMMGLIVAWEAGVRIFDVSTIVLPAPSAVFLEIYNNFWKLALHTWTTTYEIIAGFLVGIVLGIGTALLMVQVPFIRSSVYPIVIASQTIPKIAVAPLIVIWFGVGIYPKILIVALLAFFPVLVNTMAGFESTDRRHLDLMRSVNASEAKIYWYIRIPTAVPLIFSGLKLGITASVIGAIVGEWVASSKGLGYLLLFYTQYMDMNSTFAVLVILIVLGVACFAAVDLIERAVSWESKVRRKTTVNVSDSGV
jgi:NitT/TauT family transport system permease protein